MSTEAKGEIDLWGQIIDIIKEPLDMHRAHRLILRDRPYALKVMRAYMDGFKPQLGGYAVVYKDKRLGYLSQEEFDKFKEEGTHGL